MSIISVLYFTSPRQRCFCQSFGHRATLIFKTHVCGIDLQQDVTNLPPFSKECGCVNYHINHCPKRDSNHRSQRKVLIHSRSNEPNHHGWLIFIKYSCFSIRSCSSVRLSFQIFYQKRRRRDEITKCNFY